LPPPYGGFISNAHAQNGNANGKNQEAEDRALVDKRAAVLIEKKNAKFNEDELLEDINVGKKNNGQLKKIVGDPISAQRLMYRAPTPFEQMLIAADDTQPIAKLHRYILLTYADKKGRDDAVEKVKPNKDFAHVSADTYMKSSALPGENSGWLGTSADAGKQWGMHALRFVAPTAADPTRTVWDKVKGSAWITALDNGIWENSPDLNPNPATGATGRGSYRKHLSFNAKFPRFFDQPDEGKDFEGSADGHGTHVASVMAGIHDNGGTAGGCPGCSLIAIRKMGSTLQNAPTVVRAVDIGSQVINMSFETTDQVAFDCASPSTESGPLCTALTHAARNGVTLVAAAGNFANRKFGDSGQAHPELYPLPATHPDVLAISGLQFTAGSVSFWDGVENYALHAPLGPKFGSNFGKVVNGVPQISFAAPAAKVLASVYADKTWVPQTAPGSPGAGYGCGDLANDPSGAASPAGSALNADGIGFCTGTSMAAPHVAAMAGLVKSANPLLDTARVKSVLIQASGCLETGTDKPCTPLSPLTNSNGVLVPGDAMKKLGYGIPKADKAVEIALGGPSAVNRMTPLFAYFQQTQRHSGITQGHQHFYTTNPQMAVAALRNTLLPSPKFKISPSTIDCVVSPSNCLNANTLFGIQFNVPISVKLPNGGDCFSPNCGIDWLIERSADSFRKTFTSDVDGIISAPPSKLQNIQFIANDVFKLSAISEYPLTYTEIGQSIPGYPNLPCGSEFDPKTNTNGSCKYYPARAIAMLMTTHVNPFVGTNLIPLYRLSCAPEDTCNESNDPALKPYHVTFRYVTSEALKDQLTAGAGAFTYKLDGIEGYVFPVGSQPPGAKRLCSRYDAAMADYILFLEGEGRGVTGQPAATCETTFSDGLAGGFSYGANTQTLGYAYPVQRPKALPEPSNPPKVKNDHNADAVADVVLQDSSGNLSMWPMAATTDNTVSIVNPGSIVPAAGVAALPATTGWKVVGTGDVNGDGKADLILQTPSNGIYVYLMNGKNVTAHGYIYNPDASWPWKVVGVGDFNGDGFDDLLLQNEAQSSELVISLMSGSSVPGAMSLAGVAVATPPNGPGWRVKGVGDLDGDGKADIIFQQNGLSAGSSSRDSIHLYLMNGTSIATSRRFYDNPNPSSWNFKVVGLGDIDNDGYADIVAQYDPGVSGAGRHIYYWPMRGGTQLTPGHALIVAPTGWDWEIKGIRDINGDGLLDLVIQKATTTAYGPVNSVSSLTIPAGGLTFYGSVLFSNPYGSAWNWEVTK
jgi:subtilisin family serine protease